MLHMVYIETEFSYLEKQKHEELKDTNPKVPVSLRGSHKKVCRRYAIYYISSVLLSLYNDDEFSLIWLPLI